MFHYDTKYPSFLGNPDPPFPSYQKDAQRTFTTTPPFTKPGDLSFSDARVLFGLEPEYQKPLNKKGRTDLELQSTAVDFYVWVFPSACGCSCYHLVGMQHTDAGAMELRRWSPWKLMSYWEHRGGANRF